MKYTFKKVYLSDPKLMDRLEELGGMGYAVVAHVPSAGRDISDYFLMQRDVLGDVDVEDAIRKGIYDAFSGWVDGMSVATKRKIFNPERE
jgi:hypothetical protein